MPLPLLIPIALGAASIITGLTATKHGEHRIKKAQEHLQAEYDLYKAQHEETAVSVNRFNDEALPLFGQSRLHAIENLRMAFEYTNQQWEENPELLGEEGRAKLEDLAAKQEAYNTIVDEYANAKTGLGTGALATLGAAGIAGAFGTAGTGAAISSLSGIYAVKAGLAWLGGGTLAAGGAGMAGGASLLGGLGGIPILAIGILKEGKADKVEKEVEKEVAKLQEKKHKLLQEKNRIDQLSLDSAELHYRMNLEGKAVLKAIMRTERSEKWLAWLYQIYQLIWRRPFPGKVKNINRIITRAATLQATLQQKLI